MILPWHNHAFLKFDKMIKQNRLPHALLISGPKQIAKFEFVKMLIKHLLCKDNACGTCALCVGIDSDNVRQDLDKSVLIRRSHYQNMVYCRSEIGANGHKLSDIKVDQIRFFCETLYKTADNLRIGVLFYAEQMNLNAANSLLKTLEEPRDNVLLILLTHNKKKLPITILSRCQNIHIAPSYSEQTQNWILANLSQQQIVKHNVKKLLENANGVAFKVISDLTSDGFVDYESWQQQLIDIAVNPMKIDEVTGFNGNEIAVLKCLQNLVITACRLKVLRTTSTSLVGLNKIIIKAETKILFKLLDDICYAIMLTKTTVNIKLLLDNVLILWSHIASLKKYTAIRPQF